MSDCICLAQLMGWGLGHMCPTHPPATATWHYPTTPTASEETTVPETSAAQPSETEEP